MRLLHTTNQLTTFLDQITHVGLLRGLFIRIYGTAATGQTLAIGDIGKIRFQINGTLEQFVDTDKLQEQNKQWFGYLEATSASGGAFAFSLYMPFFVPDYPNAKNFSRGDAAYIGLDVGSNVATKVSSWTVEIYGEHGDVPEWYQLFNLPQDRFAVNGTSIDRVADKNIFRVFVNGSNITDVELHVDGEQVVTAKYDALISFTSLKQRIESALVSYIQLKTGETVDSFLTDNVELKVITSTSDTVKIQFIAIGLDDDRRNRSVSALQTSVSKKRQSLTSKGRGLEVAQVEMPPVATEKQPARSSVLR